MKASIDLEGESLKTLKSWHTYPIENTEWEKLGDPQAFILSISDLNDQSRLYDFSVEYFTLDKTCIYIKVSNYGLAQRLDKIPDFDFIGKILELHHMSGTLTQDIGKLVSHYAKGRRKYK